MSESVDMGRLETRMATLRVRAESLETEIDELSKLDDPTPGQTRRFEDAMRAAEKVAAELGELRKEHREAKLAEIRACAAKPSHVLDGDGARVVAVPGSTKAARSFEFVRRAGDPWERDFRMQSPDELRDRALWACERSEFISDDMAGIVETLTEERSDVPDLAARWAITTSRPAYSSMFEKYLRYPNDFQIRLTDEERSAFTDVEETRTAWLESNTGGYAVPAHYDLSLMLFNAGSSNPMRQLSTVVQTTSNIYRGLGTAGISAAFSTESTEVGDNTPALVQPEWRIHKAHSYVEASFEWVQDASSVADEVVTLFRDARDILEATAFVTGTGGGEPYGVVTQCAALNAYVFSTSGSTVERDLHIGDIYALDNAVDERHYSNATWLTHRVTANKIRRFGEGSAGSNAAFWADLGAGIPPLLLGHQLYTSSAFDSVVASGSEDQVAVLGDFRAGYKIVDRVGTSIAVNPMVTGTGAGRPKGAIGWYCYFRTGGNVTDQTNASHFKMLHL